MAQFDLTRKVILFAFFFLVNIKKKIEMIFLELKILNVRLKCLGRGENP